MHAGAADIIRATREQTRLLLAHGASSSLHHINGLEAQPTVSYGTTPIFKEHLEIAIKREAEVISGVTDPLRYRGRVCKECLTIYLAEEGCTISKRHAHLCDKLWTIDYPLLEQRRDRLVNYLHVHLAELTAQVLKEANGQNCLELFCSKMDQEYEMELPSPPRSTGDFLKDFILESVHQGRLDSLQSYENNAMLPINLPLADPSHWMQRGIKKGTTTLNDNELLEILRLRNRTFAMIKFERGLYFIEIGLSNQ